MSTSKQSRRSHSQPLVALLVTSLSVGNALPVAARQILEALPASTSHRAPRDGAIATTAGHEATPLTNAALAMARDLAASQEPLRPWGDRRQGRKPFRAMQSGSGGGVPPGALAAYALGVGLLGTGIGAGLYGSSDNCLVKNPATTCESYTDNGKFLGVMGGLMLLLGVALHEVSGSAASAPQQPVSQTFPPPLVIRPIDTEADQRTRDAIAAVRGQDHGTMPAPQVTGRNAGGATTWTFKNDTSYTLTVHLAGPMTMSLSLPPGGAQNAQLAPGRYEIAASVRALGVLPYYGVRNYDSGGQYLDTFRIMPGQRQ